MSPDSLTIFAEVGAALAGFATLAGVLRTDRRDRNISFGVVETSLIALVFALLPRVIVNLKVLALLFFLVWTTAWLNGARRNLKFTGQLAFRADVPVILQVASVATSLAGSGFSLLVLVPVWPDLAERFYTSAVICPLLISSFLLWLITKSLVLNDDGPAV